LNSQTTFSPAGRGGKEKIMKTFFTAVWLAIAVLSFGYLANNFIELDRFIEADMCLILEKR
jgi:hypothetical protein